METCIRLKNESSETTRTHFLAAIAQLSGMFELGFSAKTRESSERVYPITIVNELNTTNDVVWFSINNTDYLQHFKSLSRVVMERNLVGDKYQIITNPGPRVVE